MTTDFLRWFHAIATVGWLLFIIPVMLFKGWQTSVALLVFISIYANVAGHFSSWQAVRAEEAAESNSSS
jgi:hypothetical protein